MDTACTEAISSDCRHGKCKQRNTEPHTLRRDRVRGRKLSLTCWLKMIFFARLFIEELSFKERDGEVDGGGGRGAGGG